MVELAGADVAAILTRAPGSGGKTRLFNALGRPPDPALLTALLLDTADAADLPDVQRVLVVEPAEACEAVRVIAPQLTVIAQRGGTLGERMAAAMHDLFGLGARAVALIGSDLPDLPPDRLQQAFAYLRQTPEAVVLGPATDGGYYLVAATAVPPIFDALEWGSAVVLEETLSRARARDYPVHLLEPAGDVDSVADLIRIRARRTRAWRAANPVRCP